MLHHPCAGCCIDRCLGPCTIEAERQIDMWFDFFTTASLTIRPSCGGLGIFATRKINYGTVIARSVLDEDLWWPELGTLAEGVEGRAAAFFGPVSLLNAASCCRKHANTIWKREGAEYVAMVDSWDVRSGTAFLVPYTQPGPPMRCVVCDCVIPRQLLRRPNQNLLKVISRLRLLRRFAALTSAD